MLRATWLWWLTWENRGLWGKGPASCWETDFYWGIDTSCLPGRRLSVPALQLLHPSPTEGLDPHAPWATHALPRGTPHHQGHPLHRCLLCRSLIGQAWPPRTFFSLPTTTAPQPLGPRGPREPSSATRLLTSYCSWSCRRRERATGQRQSTPPQLGLSWCPGQPGEMLSTFTVCTKTSFPTCLPEKPSPLPPCLS